MSELDQSVAIEARDLSKSFRLRDKRRGGARRAFPRPGRRDVRTVRVLDGLTFDVQSGELFGVIGRDGAGKTTLLRILASIYRADGGTVRAAGSVAPLIGLGGVFNPGLSAVENLGLLAAAAGASPDDVLARLDEILAFAQVEDLKGVEIKSLSAGTRVQLAFATMLAADPDILLIDEVLSIGGAAMYERSMQELSRVRDEGKTIVIVSNRLETIVEHCDRAMLLDDGRIERLGDPAEVTTRYREQAGASDEEEGGVLAVSNSPGHPPSAATITDLWVGEVGGVVGDRLMAGEPIRVGAEIAIASPIEEGWLQLALRDAGGERVFRSKPAPAEHVLDLRPGERIHLVATIENQLRAGSYEARLTMRRLGPDGHRRAATPRTQKFEVSGGAGNGDGRSRSQSLQHSITLERDREPQRAAG